MIYITGDCHSEFHRFNTQNFPEQKEMTKEDIVIICGDFGGVWYDAGSSSYSKNEDYWLDWLDSKPFTTVFVDGNHENFDRLYNDFQIKNWKGGKVHEIRPSILHLMRGEVFELEGLKFFAFGGASSHDIQGGIIERDSENYREEIKKAEDSGLPYRINHLSWWKEELPSEEEMKNGRNNLKKYNNKVDFVITHSPPASVVALLGSGLYNQDILTRYLEEIRATIKYKKWFSGHMHVNRCVNNEDLILYEQIIRVH